MISAAGSYRPQLVDVWSLGVVLFAMLTGHLPFCDPDTHTLYRKILSGQLTIPAHVSPPARHLLENMLAVSPARRYGFEQIRRHEWLQTVRGVAVRGLGRGERVAVDEETLRRMGKLGTGFSEGRVRTAVGRDERNRETATYWLLVRKAAREGRKIACHFASDGRTVDLTKSQEEKFEGEDTESFGEEGVQIVAPEAPTGEDVNGPSPNGQPSDYLQLPEDSEDFSGRDSVASWVFSGVMEQIQMEVQERYEDFQPMDSPSKRCKRKHQSYALQKKEAEFYGNNWEHRLGKVSLQEGESDVRGEQVQISTRRRLRLKSVSIPKNELQTCRREKTEAVRNKPSSKKSAKQ